MVVSDGGKLRFVSGKRCSAVGGGGEFDLISRLASLGRLTQVKARFRVWSLVSLCIQGLIYGTGRSCCTLPTK